MTAAAVAALTVYDMVKGIERGVEIRSVAPALEERRPPRLAPRGALLSALRAAILTVSASRAAGEGEDRAAPSSPPSPSGWGPRSRPAR